MFRPWVPNEIWISMLMSSSKLFLYSNKAFLNSGARLLLESRSVIVIKHAAFFTHLRETNNGIQLTRFLSQFCFRMWLRFRI